MTSLLYLNKNDIILLMYLYFEMDSYVKDCQNRSDSIQICNKLKNNIYVLPLLRDI